MLSVVIPCYNDEHRLACCLHGLSLQRFGRQDDTQPSRYELILVNDGGDRAIVERQAQQHQARVGHRNVTVSVQHLPPSEQFRAGAARNRGGRLAMGDRILFLDADCVPAPNVLAAHNDYESFEVVVLGSRHHIREERIAEIDLTRLKSWHQLSGINDVDARYKLGGDYREAAHFLKRGHTCFPVNYAFCWSCHMSVPTKTFRELGGFWEELEGYGSEDQELGWRMQRHGCSLIARFDLIVYHLDHPRRAPADGLSASERRRQVLQRSMVQTSLVRNGGPLR